MSEWSAVLEVGDYRMERPVHGHVYGILRQLTTGISSEAERKCHMPSLTIT